jgi:uncharacterized protein
VTERYAPVEAERQARRRHDDDDVHWLVRPLAAGMGLIRRRLVVLGRRFPVQRLEPELQVTRLDVRIPDLPVELEGFRIAQISDLHVGPGEWKPGRLTEVIETLKQVQPDVVVNTGDFMQDRPPIANVLDVATELQPDGDRKDPGPTNLAIFGNHDYYAGDEMVDELRRELEAAGIQVLVNAGVCIARDGRGISFVGLTADVPGFDQGIARLLDVERPRILLIHEPDLLELVPAGAADLALAGHTHGGQVVLPGLQRLIVKLFCSSRYTEGMTRVNDIPMYINRGLGCTGLPIRFGASPELTVLRLVR